MKKQETVRQMTNEKIRKGYEQGMWDDVAKEGTEKREC